MELKQKTTLRIERTDFLLIVPYGIETWNRENAYNDPSAF